MRALIVGFSLLFVLCVIALYTPDADAGGRGGCYVRYRIPQYGFVSPWMRVTTIRGFRRLKRCHDYLRSRPGAARSMWMLGDYMRRPPHRHASRCGTRPRTYQSIKVDGRRPSGETSFLFSYAGVHHLCVHKCMCRPGWKREGQTCTRWKESWRPVGSCSIRALPDGKFGNYRIRQGKIYRATIGGKQVLPYCTWHLK